MISLILFGLLAGLLLLSVPVAISLAIASTVALIVSGTVSGSYVPQGLVTSIDSFPLMAVPFFILAGDLMGRGGLSQRLINVGRMFFGRYTGGMAIIAVVTCIFFAAISGSGPATDVPLACAPPVGCVPGPCRSVVVPTLKPPSRPVRDVCPVLADGRWDGVRLWRKHQTHRCTPATV